MECLKVVWTHIVGCHNWATCTQDRPWYSDSPCYFYSGFTNGFWTRELVHRGSVNLKQKNSSKYRSILVIAESKRFLCPKSAHPAWGPPTFQTYERNWSYSFLVNCGFYSISLMNFCFQNWILAQYTCLRRGTHRFDYLLCHSAICVVVDWYTRKLRCKYQEYCFRLSTIRSITLFQINSRHCRGFRWEVVHFQDLRAGYVRDSCTPFYFLQFLLFQHLFFLLDFFNSDKPRKVRIL